ncbi:hypothetical protein I6E29_00800 [Arcanobacterium haemolyticum]|nr:hypothetical protein [Arcanobacterium haemolyticum]
MTEYKNVAIDIDESEQLNPVHLDVLDVKLDLPNLQEANLPIELVQAVLLIKSKTVMDDETSAQVMSIFLAYFESMQPNFWSALRKSGHPMEYLTATVKAWADESDIDPKALS